MNENPDMSNKEKDKAGKLAFNDLLKPISARIMVARILAVASALLSVGPYIVLVELSGILLHAWREDLTPDPVEVRNALTVLIWLFLAKLALYFLALTVTHFADIRLRTILQERIAQRISRAPLSWFSKTNSGLVRKAIQDDPADIHTVVAHAPVDNTIAILSPVALLGYAFYLNWLLGLIAIATIPFYLGAMAYMVRDMGEKLQRWIPASDMSLPLWLSLLPASPSSKRSGKPVKPTNDIDAQPKNSINSIWLGVGRCYGCLP